MFGIILRKSAMAPMLLPHTQLQLIQKAGVVTSQPKILYIRKKKVRKMKRRKRQQKDWWQTKKKHKIKKDKAEALFRARMREMLTDLEQFDPMKYVKDTMASAKKEWSVDLAPTGRRRYPHWSTLMSLEELFGVEKGDYIDKRYGLPSVDDIPLLNKLREEYQQNYVKDPVKLLEKLEERHKFRKSLEGKGEEAVKDK